MNLTKDEFKQTMVKSNEKLYDQARHNYIKYLKSASNTAGCSMLDMSKRDVPRAIGRYYGLTEKDVRDITRELRMTSEECIE